MKAYDSAKLAQILTMNIFVELLKLYNVTINAMHSGMVRTKTGMDNRTLYRWFKKTLISNAHFFYTPSREGIGEIEHSELENLKSAIRKILTILVKTRLVNVLLSFINTLRMRYLYML